MTSGSSTSDDKSEAVAFFVSLRLCLDAVFCECDLLLA